MITAKANIRDKSVDLIGKQGTTWSFTIDIYTDDANTIPMPLTNYLARGQGRANYADATALFNFTCLVVPVDITANPDGNKLAITLTPAESSALTTLSGVYDIEIYNGTDIVERVLEGKFEIDPEVTK